MLNQLGLPTLADVTRAAENLEGVARKTPCVRSDVLSCLTGADVVLKFENCQHTGSYKMRGAYFKLVSLDDHQRMSGVVTASAGNHAQGTAFAASRLRVRSTIVMPEATPYCKIRNTERYGAHVVLHGTNISDALAEADRIARAEERTLVVPFDDPLIVAGAGTVGLEMLHAFHDLQVLLVQVGGGGLISGMALAAKAINPTIRVIGVQTALYPGLYNVRHALPAPIGGATLAEGVAVVKVGELNLAMTEALVDDVLLVDEEAIEHAIHLLIEEEKTLVEGAGALGVAGLLKYSNRFRGLRVGLILSGGNLDTGLLAYVIARERVRQHRVMCLRVQMLDAPGGLARVTDLVAQQGANVLEVSHRRMFTNVLAKYMQLDLTVELRHPDDIHTIILRLNAQGFDAVLPLEESS